MHFLHGHRTHSKMVHYQYNRDLTPGMPYKNWMELLGWKLFGPAYVRRYPAEIKKPRQLDPGKPKPVKSMSIP